MFIGRVTNRTSSLFSLFQHSLRRRKGSSSSVAIKSPGRKLNAPSLAEFIAASVDLKLGKLQEENILLSTTSKLNIYIETYGCQMNVSDTEIVLSILNKAGHERCTDIAQADVVITNTCAVRENAEDKVHHRLQYFQSLRKKNRIKGSKHLFPLVGVLGCMAERLKDRLLAEESVDFVCGPDAYRDLPRLLDSIIESMQQSAKNERQKVANTLLSLEETYADIRPVRIDNSSNAYVSIMRGCNNMCSFCIVPFTRGRERSRPFQSIVDEITALVRPNADDSGVDGDMSTRVREVTLLGQNVNGYHDTSAESAAMFPTSVYKHTAGFDNLFKSRRRDLPGARFPDLLRAVSDIDPELRVRFTSPHPKDFPDEVLDLIAERPNLCNSLHLPVQSGSTSALKRMRRGYSREAYLDLIRRVREKIPDVCISTDIIAGFCDESEEEHRESLSLMAEVAFDQAFMFAYSLRDKTHAAHSAAMSDSVLEEVKQRRLREIIDVFRSNVQRRNVDTESGRLRLVLVEGLSTRSEKEVMMPGQGDNGEQRSQRAQIQDAIRSGKDITLTGRTDGNKRIIFPARAVLSSLQGLDLESWASQERHRALSQRPQEPEENVELLDWVKETVIQEGESDQRAFLRRILFGNVEDIPHSVRARLLQKGLDPIGTHILQSGLLLTPGDELIGNYVIVRILKADSTTMRGVALAKSSITEFSRLKV